MPESAIPVPGAPVPRAELPRLALRLLGVLLALGLTALLFLPLPGCAGFTAEAIALGGLVPLWLWGLHGLCRTAWRRLRPAAAG